MIISHHLYVFNYVISYGRLYQGKYYLDELCAWHDFDGYTCYFGYKDLTMSLFFHNTFDYDYQEKSTFKDFTVLIEQLYSELQIKKNLAC